MQRFVIHSGILLLSFLSIFLWQKSSFASYTVPLLGILTAFYVIINFKKTPSTLKYASKEQILTVFLLNTSALLLIQTTGGLSSFLFFLLYFLCFYISFSLVSETVFLFCLAALLFFLPEASTGNTMFNFTKLISLLLICPLAYFFGKEIIVKEKQDKELIDLKLGTIEKAEQITKDVESLVKSEGKSLKEQDIETLKDIVNQSKQLEKEAK